MFKNWTISMMTGDSGGCKDAQGLYDGGCRVGRSICCKWPSMLDATLKQMTFCYRTQDHNKFDLCKVMTLSYLTPVARSLAWVAGRSCLGVFASPISRQSPWQMFQE